RRQEDGRFLSAAKTAGREVRAVADQERAADFVRGRSVEGAAIGSGGGIIEGSGGAAGLDGRITGELVSGNAGFVEDDVVEGVVGIDRTGYTAGAKVRGHADFAGDVVLDAILGSDADHFSGVGGAAGSGHVVGIGFETLVKRPA